MGRLGAPELIVILVVVILLFGAKKLPDLARSIGSSAKEFRKGIEEGMTDEDDEGTTGEDGHSSKPPTSDSSKPPSSDG